jgi:hypothetical protein
MHSEKIWHKKKPRLSRKWDRRGKMISFGSAPGDIARGDNTLRRSNGIRSTSTYDEVLLEDAYRWYRCYNERREGVKGKRQTTQRESAV